MTNTDSYILILLPFISALIGWVTNYLAIKMLFYPREEKNFYFFKLHGIFPKKQEALARKQSVIVANRLFSIEELKQKMNETNAIGEINQLLDRELDIYLRDKVASIPVLSSLIGEKRIQQLKNKVISETEEMVPRLTESFIEKLSDIDIESIVYEKIKSFSSEEFEDMLMAVMKKELKFIEGAGAILGFLVGLIQVLLLLLTSN